jgi:hypothetical protein
VICLCICRSFTSVPRIIFTRNIAHVRVHLRWPDFIFVYFRVISMFTALCIFWYLFTCNDCVQFQCSTHCISYQVFVCFCNQSRPPSIVGIFHDVIVTRCHKRFISCWDLSWGYLFFVSSARSPKLFMLACYLAPLIRLPAWPRLEASWRGLGDASSDALTTSLRSYGPRTTLRRLVQFHSFLKCNNTFIGQLTQGWHRTTRAICSQEQFIYQFLSNVNMYFSVHNVFVTTRHRKCIKCSQGANSSIYSMQV